MPLALKVIDLFAGPGGLGEGFSSLKNQHGEQLFKIALSIEKEHSAHSTLLLRAFYRQFANGEAPPEYYRFLRGELGQSAEDELFLTPRFRKEVAAARREARCLELGKHNTTVDDALKEALRSGEDCVLIGGPPCQAYSLVGRARRRGIQDYAAEMDDRNFLYKEYLRILKRCRPSVFVMENVKGMLSAKVGIDRVFDRVIEDLSRPWGRTRNRSMCYRIFSLVTAPMPTPVPEPSDPHDFVVRMENYGIPQARHRVILLGIREDLADRWNPNVLLKKAAPTTVADVTSTLPRLRSGLSKEPDSFTNWVAAIRDIRKFKLAEVRRTAGDAIWHAINAALRDIAETPDSRGQTFSPDNIVDDLFAEMPVTLKQWYADPANHKLLCNHETRGHMRSDLHRYLFCAAWAKASRDNARPQPAFPHPTDYPSSLAPAHGNFLSGAFADRFRVQIPERHASTITSHIAKDGHYFIHYDPAQCRSLTVREAARIQTFPDNYFFQGNRTEQYVQVGNAVPPLLAAQIARSVAHTIGLG